jgi:hypothetical protein
MENSITEKSPKLTLVPKPEAEELHLGGLAPSPDMQPGEYRVACQAAWAEKLKKGRKGREPDWRVTIEFRVIEGPHCGTMLSESIPAAKAGGQVNPHSRYAKECMVALGRPLNVTDKIKNPGPIFKSKFFRAFVGFRKSETTQGGKTSDDYTFIRKDSGDYLRVYKLLERVEL